MRVLCASDSFKESLSAQAASEAMARGARRADAEVTTDICPIADGGEGFVDAMLLAGDGSRRATRVLTALGEPIEAVWGVLDQPGAAGPDGKPHRLAVIEMAAAAGLGMISADRRDPERATTFGVGQLILAALEEPAVGEILIGIGGSATNDGGCGMAQALGATFITDQGPLDRPFTGADLLRLRAIDLTGLDRRLKAVTVRAACDVTNPLTGERGAAAVYGPQKGADPAMVRRLDNGLAHLARILREQHGLDVETIPGAGAAGGLGAGLLAFTQARLTPGIDCVLSAVGFAARAARADLCLTGEGRLDGSSLEGKACLGVARAAAPTPTIAIVGALGPGAHLALDAGLAGLQAISEGLTIEQSIQQASELVEAAAEAIVRRFTRRT